MQAIRGLAVTLFLLGGASAESCDDGAQLDCAGVCGGNNEMNDCGIPTKICGKPDLCPSGFERREGALNPFDDIADIADVGYNSAPAFVDTDNDGDLDLVIGRHEGDLKFYYENTGSWDAATPPVFTPSYTRRKGALNPFHDIADVGINSAPAFVDTDNDGDLDLVIGRHEGNLKFYYENTGSWDAATPPVFTPSYTRREGVYNPFDGVADVGQLSFPAFVDTDNDGDLDLVIGRGDPGDLKFYYENIPHPLSTNGVVAGFKAARYSMSGTDLLTALSAKQGSSC